MNAIGEASEALLVLRAALRRDPVPSPLPCAAEALSALERIMESAYSRVSLTILAHALRRGEVERFDVDEALEALGEAALEERLATEWWRGVADLTAAALATLPPAPSSRPASPPPPSNDGDELALEMAAGYAARGDTLPPLAEACGADTEPPGPGSVEWWDEQPTVRS